MYQKALVATDGSGFSKAAITHVVKLAPAQVVVVQVPDSVPMLLAGAGAPGFVDADTAQRLADAELAEVDKSLANAKAALEAAGITNVQTVVGRGRPGDAIVQAAKEQGCDVIVLATHGRSGISRAMLGSVADYVVHHAEDAAVLLVRPPKS
ncbi:MAG: universal stress protein [Chloroflexi bacterium]|nr:universal stress protein [Chloroflexota bacterium]MDA1146214.1 universal stress protein [Chloroflexota bacterium]